MIQIVPEVANIIKGFVEKSQSFISLDVYCKLGQHFDVDGDNPIHEQVRAAYGTDLMPNYLCKWVCLRLEGGGFSNCWKYYLPKASSQRYEMIPRSDGRVELSKKILGAFALLECDLGLKIEPELITLHLCNGEETHIVNASNRIIISSNMMKSAGLDKAPRLAAIVYSNKIEIMRQ